MTQEEYIEHEVQIRLNDKRFNIIKLKLNLFMAWFTPKQLYVLFSIQNKDLNLKTEDVINEDVEMDDIKQKLPEQAKYLFDPSKAESKEQNKNVTNFIFSVPRTLGVKDEKSRMRVIKNNISYTIPMCISSDIDYSSNTVAVSVQFDQEDLENITREEIE